MANCAEKDAIYEPLKAQWTFDEKLIAKALQNVGTFFPHYSRHDESHSRQILVHIERLLGENIAKLTATDTWLLLEAAYNHDIGMVVTDEQLNKDFPDIKKHVEKTKHSAHGDTLTIMNALVNSKTSDASWIFTTANVTPVHANKILREIIADFYRAKHPERAKNIIHSPMDEIGLNSPRNELLPARLFGLLEKICEYHGADFKKVMELPKQQVGIGTDDCHPRFVACLLRLGDLLDLDDNRFCPVMMKMAGELPAMSKTHHEKHLSIRHFRADPERIEIEAECPNYESYIETTKWFGWLREEVKNQMSCWFDIVPSRDFGLLPSVGDLKAHLKDWQVFNENERPHFTLDRDRIFELLQGAGLYENKGQAMRELLQNAVDATLIRIWREHGEGFTTHSESVIKKNSSPNDAEAILNQYPIEITINKEHEEELFNYWRITITDQGTGISTEDLKFMLQMGSSKKNLNKRGIIDNMPIWMKPSGIFGIGLHSVFLLTDEVWLETRSIDTGETLIIRLTDPSNLREQGNVYFQIITEPKTITLNYPGKIENTLSFTPWSFSGYGCSLSFIYKSEKNTKPDFMHDDARSAMKNYDGLLDISGDFNIYNITGGISDFFINSLLIGKLRFNKEYQILKSTEKNSNLNFYAFEEQLELVELMEFSYNSSYYYRGQEVSDRIEQLEFVCISVNFFDLEADQILSINRNRFKNEEVKQKLFNRIGRALQAFFKSQNGKNYYGKQSEKYKNLIAAEYELQGWSAPDYFSNWEELSIKTNLGIKGLKELLHYDVIFFAEPYTFFDEGKLFEFFEEESGTSKEKIMFIPFNSLAELWLESRFLKNNKFKPTYIIKGKGDILKLIKTEQEPLSESLILSYCQNNLLDDNNYYKGLLKRQTIPCLSQYTQLALTDLSRYQLSIPPVRPTNTNGIPFAFFLDFISPRMIFPLARFDEKITVGDLAKLAKQIYESRQHQDVTETKIIEIYQKFIAFLDKLMQGDDKWRKLRGDEFINPEK